MPPVRLPWRWRVAPHILRHPDAPPCARRLRGRGAAVRLPTRAPRLCVRRPTSAGGRLRGGVAWASGAWLRRALARILRRALGRALRRALGRGRWRGRVLARGRILGSLQRTAPRGPRVGGAWRRRRPWRRRRLWRRQRPWRGGVQSDIRRGVPRVGVAAVGRHLGGAIEPAGEVGAWLRLLPAAAEEGELRALRRDEDGGIHGHGARRPMAGPGPQPRAAGGERVLLRELRHLLSPALQEPEQHLVEAAVEDLEGQVVSVLAEWVLDLHRDVVHRPVDEDDEKRVDPRFGGVPDADGTDQRDHQRAEEGEHDHDHLRELERKGNIGELPRVYEVHDTDGKLLEGP
mmetsp:Transcript_121411/g.339991  ORF Transcript_121411/g.339991 Transcript_121411/m.339991 type:complete len:346 (+) Transcript_121411:47-1084(+)